jgi:hypothetical protein
VLPIGDQRLVAAVEDAGVAGCRHVPRHLDLDEQSHRDRRVDREQPVAIDVGDLVDHRRVDRAGVDVRQALVVLVEASLRVNAGDHREHRGSKEHGADGSG